MLGSLRGTVTAQLGNRTLIEVQGVGYWVYTGSWQPSGAVTCYLYQHVREDINDLYGFSELPILTLFEQLIGVSGVGPKAALAILSLGSSGRIATAILQEDSTFLSLAPGIGKKVAEKIILELKGKVQVDQGDTAAGQLVPDDLLIALEALGYKAADYRSFLADLPSELTTLNEQIRWILGKMR